MENKRFREDLDLEPKTQQNSKLQDSGQLRWPTVSFNLLLMCFLLVEFVVAFVTTVTHKWKPAAFLLIFC